MRQPCVLQRPDDFCHTTKDRGIGTADADVTVTTGQASDVFRRDYTPAMLTRPWFILAAPVQENLQCCVEGDEVRIIENMFHGMTAGASCCYRDDAAMPAGPRCFPTVIEGGAVDVRNEPAIRAFTFA
jgi:hypothetical protein